MEPPVDTPPTRASETEALARLRNEKSVIEQVYAATTNPEYLDDFERYWEAYIDMLLQQHDDPSGLLANAPVNDHIARAVSIIERLGTLGTTQSRAQQLVEATPGPALMLDCDRRIVAANADADRWLAALPPAHGDGAPVLTLDRAAQMRLDTVLDAMRQGRVDDTNALLFVEGIIGDPVDDGVLECLLGTVVMRPLDDAAHGQPNGPSQARAHLLLTSVDLDIGLMDAESRAPFTQAFGLTETETDIALALAAGASAREIATRRGVRKATLDKQIKTIRAKTGTRSIAELVRKLSLMVAKSRTVEAQLSRIDQAGDGRDALTRRSVVFARDGRRISLVEQGHPRGRAVIVTHNILGTGILPEAAAREAVLRGLRIIMPWRAGFESSEAMTYRDVPHVLNSNADDLADVLDALGVHDAVLLGTRIAQRFCTRYPDRARALILLNGFTDWQDSYLSHYAGRRRSMLKTSLYAPSAVRYLVRVAHMLIRSGRADVFVRQLNKNCPIDTAVLTRPDCAAVIEEGTRAMTAQGADPYAWGVQLMHTDLTDEMLALSLPVGLIYGVASSFMRLEPEVGPRRAAQIERLDAIDGVKGAAGYGLLTHPDRVFDMIDRLDPKVQP